MKFESQFGICDLCFEHENVLLLDCACGKSICYRCAYRYLSFSVAPFIIYEDLKIRCSQCFFAGKMSCWYCGGDTIEQNACKCSIVFHKHCGEKFSVTKCPLHNCWKCRKYFTEYRYCCYLCLHTFHKGCLEQAILLDRDEPEFSACLCSDCCRRYKFSNSHAKTWLAAAVKRITGQKGISLSSANVFFYQSIFIECLSTFFLKIKTQIYESVSAASYYQLKALLPIVYDFVARSYTTEYYFVLFQMLSAVYVECLHISHSAGLFGGLACIFDLFMNLVDYKELRETSLFAYDVFFGYHVDCFRFYLFGSTDRVLFGIHLLYCAADTVRSMALFSEAAPELYNLLSRRLVSLAEECYLLPFRAHGSAIKIASYDVALLRYLANCSTAIPANTPILLTLETLAQIILAKKTNLLSTSEMEHLFGKAMVSIVSNFATYNAGSFPAGIVPYNFDYQHPAAIALQPGIYTHQNALFSSVVSAQKPVSSYLHVAGPYADRPQAMRTETPGMEPQNKPMYQLLFEKTVPDKSDKQQTDTYKVQSNYSSVRPMAASPAYIPDSRWLWQSSDKDSQRIMRQMYIATAGYIYNFTGSSTISIKYIWNVICLIRQEMQQSLKVDPSKEQVYELIQRLTSDRNLAFLRQVYYQLIAGSTWLGVNPIDIPFSPHFFFVRVSKSALIDNLGAGYYPLMRGQLRDYVKVVPPYMWNVDHLIGTIRKDLINNRLNWHTAHIMFYFAPNQPPVVCRTKYSDFEQPCEALAVYAPQYSTASYCTGRDVVRLPLQADARIAPTESSSIVRNTQATQQKTVANAAQSLGSNLHFYSASSTVMVENYLAEQKYCALASTSSEQTFNYTGNGKVRIRYADSVLYELRTLAPSAGGLSTENYLRMSVVAYLRKEQLERLEKHRNLHVPGAFCFEMPDYLRASLSELQAFLAELRQQSSRFAVEQTIEFAEDYGYQYSAYVHSSEY